MVTGQESVTDTMQRIAVLRMPSSGLNVGYEHAGAATDQERSPVRVKKQKHINSSRTLEPAKRESTSEHQAVPNLANTLVGVNSIGSLVDSSHLNDRAIHIMQTMQPHINKKKSTQFRVSNLQTSKQDDEVRHSELQQGSNTSRCEITRIGASRTQQPLEDLGQVNASPRITQLRSMDHSAEKLNELTDYAKQRQKILDQNNQKLQQIQVRMAVNSSEFEPPKPCYTKRSAQRFSIGGDSKVRNYRRAEPPRNSQRMSGSVHVSPPTHHFSSNAKLSELINRKSSITDKSQPSQFNKKSLQKNIL